MIALPIPRTPLHLLFLAVASSFVLSSLAFARDTDLSDASSDALATAEAPQDIPGHTPGPRDLQHAHPPERSEIPPESPRSWFGHAPWYDWDFATGDWAGLRTSLSDAGVDFAGSYTFEWSSVWSGGARNSASSRSLLDLNLTLDLHTLLAIPGASLFFDFYSTDGRGQADAGDFQGFSNIATDANVDQIAELWFQQLLFDDRLRIKFGKIDANSEFGFPSVSADFLHSAAAYSATSFDYLPTYPDPATGLVIFAYPAQWLDLGFGLFDGAAADGFRLGGRGPATFFSDSRSSDWFIIAEAGINWNNLSASNDDHRRLKGRFALGLWHHTGDLPRFDSSLDPDGSTAFYFLAEQRLLARSLDAPPEGEEDDRGLWIFFQYGYADDAVNSAGNHLALGLVLLGTFPSRDSDSAGVYVSFADLSDDPASGFSEDETAVELFYKLQATPFFSIRPDLQIIANPGGDPSLDTAVVAALRFEIAF